MDDYRTKLITKNRIDTIVGIKYCESYDKLYNTSFFHDLYISYKYAFNGLKETSVPLLILLNFEKKSWTYTIQ